MTPEPDATRQAILERLLKGEITPDDAQAEAKRLNMGSLTDPDPALFDPMAEASWTAPMALAWTATRNIGRVRAMMDGYRAECFEFAPIHDGEGRQSGWYHRPTRTRRGTIELVRMLTGEAAYRVAERNLVDTLCSPGEAPLQATAIPAIGGERGVVSYVKWIGLEFCDHKDCIYTRRKDSPYRYVHRSVLIRRDNILAHWPDETGEFQPMSASAGAEEVVETGLKAEWGRHRDFNPPR